MGNARRWSALTVLLAALGSVALAQEPSGAPPVLTLAEAVEQALARNDRLAEVRDNTELANLGLRLARSTFHPKLVPSVFGSFGQTDVANQSYRLDLTQRFTTGTEVRATVGTATYQDQLGNYYSTDTTFQVSQPLLRGFGGAARRSLSSAEARFAEVGRQEKLTEQQVTLDVAAAYLRVVAQKQLVNVAEKALERSRSLLEASEAKLSVGKVSQLDVFRARQLVAQAESQLLDAQAAVEDAADQLRSLLGHGPEYVFEVERDIPVATEEVAADAAAQIALGRRLDLRTAQEAVAEADRSASFARNQLLPQLDVSLALTRRETADSFASSFRFDNFKLATFFAISMPVDRTSQTIDYHNALIERDRRRRGLETLKRRIVEEVRRAIRQQQRLLKGFEIAETSVAVAEQEVEVASLRYQRGLSNNLDVVNAEANLLAARSRRIASRADAALGRLGLRATLGILDPRRDLRMESKGP